MCRAFCIVGLLVVAVCPRGRAEEVVFENPRLRAVLGEDAVWKSLVDKTTGKEHCAASKRVRFAAARVDGKTYSATVASFADDRLRVSFGDAEVQLVYAVSTSDQWIAFRIAEVRGTRPTHVTLLSIGVTITERGGPRLNAAWNNDYAICLRAVNLQTQGSFGPRGDHTLLSATTQDAPGPKLEDAGAALIGARPDELKPILSRLAAAFDLPRNERNGVPSRDLPMARQSYWFLSFGEKDTDRVIDYCRQTGIRQVMINSGSWCTSVGHFTFNTSRYPDGIESLRRTVAKLHAHGILVGMHTFASKVSKTDAYVTPLPNRGFWVDMAAALAEDIGPANTAIRTTTDLSQWPGSPVCRQKVWEGHVSKHQEAIIDDEIVRFESIGPQGKWDTFLGCRRGAWGTRAAAHAGGTECRHYGVDGCINGYIIDQESPLFQQTTSRLAHVFNYCDFDMVYFDGSEDVDRRRFHYFASNAHAAAMRKFRKRPLIHMGGGFTHGLWHSFTRSGTIDQYPGTYLAHLHAGGTIDKWPTCKDHIDRSLRRVVACQDEMTPGELGWFGIGPAGGKYDGLQFDEIEYLMCKSLAYNAPISLQTSFSRMQSHPLTPDVLEIVRRYEEIRLAGRVPDSTLQQLRQQGKDFVMLPAALQKEAQRPEFVQVEELSQVAGTHAVRGLVGPHADGAIAAVWHYTGKDGTLLLDVPQPRAYDVRGGPVALRGEHGKVVVRIANRRLLLHFPGLAAEEVRKALAEATLELRKPQGSGVAGTNPRIDCSCLCQTTDYVSTDIDAAADRADYRGLLKSRGAGSVVRPILAAYGTRNAEAHIEQLGGALAASPQNAAAVLDALAAEKSVEAASVGAELLYAVAARVDGHRLTDDTAWRQFAEKGAALLGHDDPLVRGIAAWALVAVRDAGQGVRPESEIPDWQAKCLALKPETSLECDFVLQAFSLGVHRTTRNLSASAQNVLKRAEQMASYVQSCGGEQRRQRVAAALEKLQIVYRRGASQKPVADPTGQRKWWLEVRRAARDVVLAGPDADFREVVFFKAHVRTEGNHPDCLVQNHDRPKERRPGGDVFVQAGLGPADPVRPVIADRLGPGHVQDMDLWWDADRVVFAYVPQPYWGNVQSTWGNVSWRNGPKVVVFDHVVGFRNGVFWENGSEPTHLYEINLDGTGLRQLTDDRLYCDREPAYLPNGDVVFSSDRGCGASQCGAAPLAYSDFGLPNLFRVSADGKNVQRLTYNKDVDRYPHCLSNGLIGYMRWDYQERFWQWPHALWTIRPDGTMNDGLFKVHFNDPQSVREPRSIPGSRKLVVLACGHHSPPEGAVAVVDPSLGANNPAGMRYVTPSVSPLEGGLGTSPAVAEGGVGDRGGFYRTPWPLSEKGFLVSYAYHNPGRTSYAAYYIDVWGNKELIHRDPIRDVLCPMPVRKRPRPPMPPSDLDPESNYATCYLDDVHRDMPGVEPGTVRHLRISERLQWFFGKNDNTGPIRWTPGTQHSRNFGYWTWSPTRVIGTVPVEKDGSAYFKVPTGMAVYFQALDEDMMEIRRMRSHIEFKPGEFRSCVGCHETKQHVPRMASRTGRLALGREPSLPKPPPWGDVEILDYEKLIQPIFDRHCVGCHGEKDPDKDLDLTGSRGPHGFVQSYRSLFGIKKDASTPLGEGYREAFPDMLKLEKDEGASYESVKKRIYSPGGLLCLSSHMSGPEVTQPKQFGSHRSRLVLSLLDDEVHRKQVSLSRDEWETLVTWVDANAPYHSTYFQYFDSHGRLLPKAIRVRVELDPPFTAGEKSCRIVADHGARR